MGKANADIAEQLLELQVRHELKALTGKQLVRDLRTEVDEIFQLGERMTLSDVVSPEQILAVIRRNVVELEIHGGIPELAGEMAAEVMAAPVQKQTPLKQLLSRDQAAEFVDEALTLRHQRESLTNNLLDHPLYQDLVATLVYHGIVNYIYEENLLSKKVPGVAATMKLGKRMFNKAIPGLDDTLEKNLKSYIARSLPFLVRQSQTFVNRALTDEELKDSAMAVWTELEDKNIAQLRNGLGDLELQEFVVLGYEFWLRFRETAYFEGCYRAVVEHLFAKYGDQPLAVLAGDMGVTPAMVKTELEAFAPSLLAGLKQHGYLEEMLRRRLAPFYRSKGVRDLLQSSSADSEPEPKPKPKSKTKPESN